MGKSGTSRLIFKKYIILFMCLFLAVLSLHCFAGFSLEWLLFLGSTGSVAVAHGLSCPVACEIIPDQGSNLGPLHWQADSLPLDPQGGGRRLTANLPSASDWV